MGKSGGDANQLRKDQSYWLSRPIEERFAEVERLRRAHFGDEACELGIARVVTITSLKEKKRSRGDL
jgi:hypothetical protein